MYHQPARPTRRAFTLTELIVVVLIIALLVGILLPTLAGVRNSARKAASSVLLSEVANAATMFQTDTRRLPGYFSASDMGQADNTLEMGGGFTSSENALIELAGGIVENKVAGNDPDATNSFVDVGPGGVAVTDLVRIDNNLVGAGKGRNSYLRLPPASEGDSQLVVVGGQFGDEIDDPAARGRTDMVDLVDSFGTPIVIFTRNEAASANPLADFAARVAPINPTSGPGAQFYWASNAGYLNSPGFAPSPEEHSGNEPFEIWQQWPEDLGGVSNHSMGSILAADNTDTNLALSLEGILGSQALPSSDPSEVDGAFAGPAAARGGFIAISAGPDKIYFARREDPGYEATANSGSASEIVTYGLMTDGQPDLTANEVGEFDDIVVSSGG